MKYISCSKIIYTTTICMVCLISTTAKPCAMEDINHQPSTEMPFIDNERLSDNTTWLSPEHLIENEVASGNNFQTYQFQVQRLHKRKTTKYSRKKASKQQQKLAIFPDSQAWETLAHSCWMFNSFNAGSNQSLNIYIQGRLPKLAKRLSKKNIVLILANPDYDEHYLYNYYWLGSRAAIDTLIMQTSVRFGGDAVAEWLSLTEQSAAVMPDLWNTVNLAVIDNYASLGLREAVNDAPSSEQTSVHHKQQLASKNKDNAHFVLGIPCHYNS